MCSAENAPTTTLSSKDRRAKARTTWKVRPTPALQTANGGSPTSSRPSSLTLPGLGTMKPLSALKSVVLPAPLGPMMPRISPLRTSNETFCSARSPPKRTDTSFTASRIGAPLSGAAPLARTNVAASSASASSVAAPRRRARRAWIHGRMPSGASSTTIMIAAPKTTPWMPGMRLPSSACNVSPSGTRMSAPMTGPATVAIPPKSVTIIACAEASMPNTAGGVTMSSTTA